MCRKRSIPFIVPSWDLPKVNRPGSPPYRAFGGPRRYRTRVSPRWRSDGGTLKRRRKSPRVRFGRSGGWRFGADGPAFRVLGTTCFLATVLAFAIGPVEYRVCQEPCCVWRKLDGGPELQNVARAYKNLRIIPCQCATLAPLRYLSCLPLVLLRLKRPYPSGRRSILMSSPSVRRLDVKQVRARNHLPRYPRSSASFAATLSRNNITLASSCCKRSRRQPSCNLPHLGHVDESPSVLLKCI